MLTTNELHRICSTKPRFNAVNTETETNPKRATQKKSHRHVSPTAVFVLSQINESFRVKERRTLNEISQNHGAKPQTYCYTGRRARTAAVEKPTWSACPPQSSPRLQSGMSPPFQGACSPAVSSETSWRDVS